MRNLIIAAIGLGSVACAGGSAKTDTGAVRDSSLVAGPAVSPATQPPPADSGTNAVPKPIPSSSGRSSGSPATQPAPQQRMDSVRGIVSVVGTSFDKHVMVADQRTQRRIEVIGSLSSLVGHVAGADVSVAGAMTGSQLNASRFQVRSVDGQPAIDGTLRTEGGALFIVTADGVRTRIATPPPSLEGHDGARVWITGDPAKGVSSFGFIDPPR